MRYLTEEWYRISQHTDLHFDMRIHSGAEDYNDALYSRLYKRKEKKFIEFERELYDEDPRFMLENDESTLIPLDAFLEEEGIKDEDIIIYHMSPEEKDHIQKLIEEYDSRPPFDEEKCREHFKFIHELKIKETADKLSPELYQQILDIRLFSLGYCTKNMKKQLKAFSKENENEMNRIFKEYMKVQEEESIPHIIKERFGFHDCETIDFIVGKNNVVLLLDTSGGFTDFNEITFVASKIIKQKGQIVGSICLYEELYRIEDGYEVHMLFTGDGEGMPELIVQCQDILIEKNDLSL
ncbi:DUF4085 family protein [Alkalibacterium olivapovliticus]|uniref:Uncharacterized protein DUF4085 n=1 Tax=Alkalibacterium olivapovliticus TaxID=99907 RepID=A0A2T0W8K3_9LACT|nr:DUF4085 family protein [Alkalibacterium olivapovliticus]PRY82864.1 uncharacterized protein DUF4085 [Alkalibacterium olivapovliticus]